MQAYQIMSPLRPLKYVIVFTNSCTKLAAGEQSFLIPYRDAKRAVMAEAPPGLCGKGNSARLAGYYFDLRDRSGVTASG
jgi:hypothetical protein